jgi:hypothetical protein
MGDFFLVKICPRKEGEGEKKVSAFFTNSFNILIRYLYGLIRLLAVSIIFTPGKNLVKGNLPIRLLS